MDPQEMVTQMCQAFLTAVDLKAICKSRGFSAQQAASRTRLETLFLSELGVTQALRALSREELILLHLLRFWDQPVDVSFFKPLYGEKKDDSRYYHYYTFTQRYKGVLKKVRHSLIRRGVLLVAESEEVWHAKSKMERLRFRFPREFEGFLPSPFEETRVCAGAGEFDEAKLREKLSELTRQSSSAPERWEKRYDLTLDGGELRLGGNEFRAAQLLGWQKAGWAAALGVRKEPKSRTEGYVSPVDAVTYGLSQLREQEWILPEELSPLLKLFCHGGEYPDARKLCRLGWEWGCLARQQVGEQTCYRLPGNYLDAGVDTDPSCYLVADQKQTLLVELRLIPYASLEYLARIAELHVVEGQLTASPNLVKLGRLMESVRDNPLARWLRENVRPFRRAMEKMAQRWGKQILHQELLLARVADLSLKVAIQRAFSDPGKLVSLPNDFIAFPRDLRGELERVVLKSGHVVKTVEAEG